jgi:putative FmdB family regulatory protein
MPLYEFDCKTCGNFEKFRTMSEASKPMLCPTCQTEAKRIYSVAGLILTPKALRTRIDKSAEPQIVNRAEIKHSHTHKHHHHHSRPWMIGH